MFFSQYLKKKWRWTTSTCRKLSFDFEILTFCLTNPQHALSGSFQLSSYGTDFEMSILTCLECFEGQENNEHGHGLRPGVHHMQWWVSCIKVNPLAIYLSVSPTDGKAITSSRCEGNTIEKRHMTRARKQKILLNNCLISRNEQDTCHKLHMWNSRLAGNLVS